MLSLEIPERTAFLLNRELEKQSAVSLRNRDVQPAMLRLCALCETMRSELRNRQYTGCKGRDLFSAKG